MTLQDYSVILKQNSLVKCVGVLESDLDIFYFNNANINLIQSDIYVRLSKISENKYQLSIAKHPFLHKNYVQIFFKELTDKKIARREYNEIIKADKKRREKIINKIFSKN